MGMKLFLNKVQQFSRLLGKPRVIRIRKGVMSYVITTPFVYFEFVVNSREDKWAIRVKNRLDVAIDTSFSGSFDDKRKIYQAFDKVAKMIVDKNYI